VTRAQIIMETAVSLPFVVGYSLLISVLLMWQNSRGASITGAVASMVAAAILLEVFELVTAPRFALARQGIQSWLFFFVLPSLAILWTSRLAAVRSRPWLLLVLGPLSHIVAMVVVMTAYNAVFASNRTR
jgi:hypothetical protein